jgi:hypothetical protein
MTMLDLIRQSPPEQVAAALQRPVEIRACYLSLAHRTLDLALPDMPVLHTFQAETVVRFYERMRDRDLPVPAEVLARQMNEQFIRVLPDSLLAEREGDHGTWIMSPETFKTMRITDPDPLTWGEGHQGHHHQDKVWTNRHAGDRVYRLPDTFASVSSTVQTTALPHSGDPLEIVSVWVRMTMKLHRVGEVLT